MEEKINETMKELLNKSKKTENSLEALQFTQSVLNLANAIRCIKEVIKIKL